MTIEHVDYILNLTPGFRPVDQGRDVPQLELAVDDEYSGGEINVRLPEVLVERGGSTLITARLSCSYDVMHVAMVANAIKHTGCLPSAFFPYIPYGRQDRVCHRGEPFGLQVFANLMAHLGFQRIYTVDPHSIKTSQLIYNIVEVKTRLLETAIYESRLIPEDYVLMGPDAGSARRVQDAWESLPADVRSIHSPVVAFKKRAEDGSISSLTFPPESVSGKHVVIVDDICDGGRTFVSLAKALRAAGATGVTLVVTHGILAYGIDAIKNASIRAVYTTDSVRDIPDNGFVRQCKLRSII